MDGRRSRRSEMKVLSLDVAFTRCDELERSIIKVNSVRFAVPASFVVVLAAAVWSLTASSVAPTAAAWTWFVSFFWLYALLAVATEVRWRKRAADLGRELAELRRWVDA